MHYPQADAQNTKHSLIKIICVSNAISKILEYLLSSIFANPKAIANSSGIKFFYPFTLDNFVGMS
jgi:hypothetical protein